MVVPAREASPRAADGPEHPALPTDRLGWAACALTAAAFATCLVLWLTGGASVSLPWAPSLGLRLDFSLDGLGALYALLATGVGTLVFAYGTRYLTEHLEHHGRPARERWRFWPWMLLFAVSMVGLATAQDVVLLFVVFDLTAVCSYFLIGFDRSQPTARRAALMALLVTVVSAVALLVAAVVLHDQHGTTSIPALLERAAPGPSTTAAAALIAVAGLAKSAQVPLHFWLPRAMAAPTPVSAYLHSAAMVAAGVLVLGRMHPLLAASEVVLDALAVVGTASIIVGGLLALAADQLKQVLAYSTISQYGYVVLLYGIGGTAAAGAAAFYVLAHGVAKSALFMTAGAVTMATGEDRLSHLGGLARRTPLLAVGAGVAAATLAALPLTVGFFKDELFFAAALDAGPLATAVAVLAAGLTFAYVGRFWGALFLGPLGLASARTAPVPVLHVAPVVLLGAVALFGGVVTAPFTRLAEDAATVTAAAPVDLSPAYHLDARPENLMALAAWGLGALLLVFPRLHRWAGAGMARAGDRFGPRAGYAGVLHLVSAVSGVLHDREVRGLRTSVAAVLVPGGVLVALAFAATPTVGAYALGEVDGGDWIVLPLLALVVVAALTLVRTRERLPVVLVLAVVGFALAGVYALLGAPDVALVAVLVETMTTLVFLGAVAHLPRDSPVVRPGAVEPGGGWWRRWGPATAGTVSGVAVFATVWGFLSEPAPTSVSAEQLRLTPSAHGMDAVTVIVTDFRGLDTLVEITVLVVAGAGVATLLRRGRLW